MYGPSAATGLGAMPVMAVSGMPWWFAALAAFTLAGAVLAGKRALPRFKRAK